MTQTAQPLSAPPRMTYEEFLQWDDENQHVEWVNGEIVYMSPVTFLHQDLVLFLATLLRHFVEFYKNGKICTDPFQMKTAPDLPGRAPDIIYVSNENLFRLHPTYLDGPADIAVEVVSPNDPKRDRVVKYREYERGGVREYWLIDPAKRESIFYRLNVEGKYIPAPIEDGIYRSVVLEGFWICVDWLWQEPLPPLLGVLREWKLL